MSSAAAIGNRSGGPEAAGAGAARAKAAIYGLLARLFRNAPDRELLSALRGKALRQALAEAGMALNDTFLAKDLDALMEELAVDFASLFLVPGDMISPHESVQIEGGSGLLRGPETARVRAYYEYVGFQVDETTPMEADHVSIELEFLQLLSNEEAAAWEAGRPGMALDALRYQRDFLERHLGKWVFRFLERIEERARQRFYRQLSDLTAAFLREQIDDTAGKIEKIQAGYGLS